jgi:hypothetical protein
MMIVRALKRVAPVVLALSVSAGARAAETGGCESFAWSVAKELAWMQAADGAATASGSKLDPTPEKAITLSLAPVSKVTFPVAPTGRRKDNAGERYGGIADFNAPAAGLYQVTLAIPGWIDVVQNGKALKPSAHSGKSDCPGVRKTVRFDLAAGPFTVELSDVTTDKINFAVRRAD